MISFDPLLSWQDFIVGVSWDWDPRKHPSKPALHLPNVSTALESDSELEESQGGPNLLPSPRQKLSL